MTALSVVVTLLFGILKKRLFPVWRWFPPTSHTTVTMALPRTHQSAFTPGEIEFIAGDEKITIIPKVKMPRMKCIQVKRHFFTTTY